MENMVRNMIPVITVITKVMNISIMMKKTTTESTMKPKKGIKEANLVKRKATRKDKKPPVITINLTKMNTIRNINSMMMLTRVDITANMETSTPITLRKVEITRRVIIMNQLTNMIIMERKAITTRDTTMKITKVTKANTDTSPTTHITKTMARKVAALAERNMVSTKVERSISAFNVHVFICYSLYFVFSCLDK